MYNSNQVQSALQQLTPEEQKLIASCFSKIKDIKDEEQQALIIQQMLPPDLVQKMMALLQAKQGFRP